MAPPPINPCRCIRQLCLFLPLLLSGTGTFATTNSNSYTSHCPSPAPAPDRHTDVGDDVELLKPFQLPNGFFWGSGAESLFSPDTGGIFGRYSSFLPRGVSRTADPTLLHLTATLTLFGSRIEKNTTYWSNYDVAISFHLDGYYSTTTSELCMVGSGTEASNGHGPVLTKLVEHYADVAVHLRVPSHPSLADPFVTGRLVATDFETIFLATFAVGDTYEYSGRASCLPMPAAAMPASRRALESQHGNFSCAALREQLMFKYRLKYGKSSSLPQLHEPRMIVNQVSCAANGAVRLYAVLSNNRNMAGPWPGMDRFLVENQAVVADGFWEPDTSRLCLHACRVVRSASDNLEVRECGIGMSFWFPAVWTVLDRSVAAGLLWNASQMGSGDGRVISDAITVSSFQKFIVNNLSDVKYVYNQTLLETAKRHCLKARSSNNDKNIEATFPGNYTYRDFEFMFSTNSGGRGGGAYPVSIGSAMVRGDELAAEYSFSRHAAAEMKQSRLVNVSYGILYQIVPTEWPEGIYDSSQDPVPFEHGKITAEGVYDTRTGFLSMVGCRELNGSTDCQVLITVQFTSLENPHGLGYGTGRISSLRDSTDDLYFETRNITLLGTSGQQASQSIRRMDLERMITLASSTLSCAFTVLQILHTKRNRDVAPATSITMLVVLALGYAIPLLVDINALVLDVLFVAKWFVQLCRDGGLLNLDLFVLKVPMLIAFVMLLRVVQLVWASRQCSDDHRWWGAEQRMLRVCLPLYLIGAAVTVAVVHFGRELGTLREALASYAGLVTDGFLLPQVLQNAISGSGVKAISPWFYVGGTVIRVAPHVYDVVRAHRYVPSVRLSSYIYASPRDGLFGSVPWDVLVSCLAVSLALLLFLQQRLGGDFFLRRKSRSGGY